MSKRQEELSKLFDRKYGETKIESSAESKLSPRQREIEELFNKMSVRNGVSSFDDLNNYFENSTKAVNSARDYYNAGTAGRRNRSKARRLYREKRFFRFGHGSRRLYDKRGKC